MDFDGHTVKDTVHGIEAVISHHVDPIIGWMRLSESEGRAFDFGHFTLAFSHAADVIEREMREKIAQEIEADLKADEWSHAYRSGLHAAARIVREGSNGD